MSFINRILETRRWYTTNFTQYQEINGERRIIYTIKNNTNTTLNNPIDLYVALQINLNDIEDNGVIDDNILVDNRPISDYSFNSNLTNNQYLNIWNGTNSSIEYPAAIVWKKIEPNTEANYILKYSAKSDLILKMVFTITSINPNVENYPTFTTIDNNTFIQNIENYQVGSINRDEINGITTIVTQIDDGNNILNSYYNIDNYPYVQGIKDVNIAFNEKFISERNNEFPNFDEPIGYPLWITEPSTIGLDYQESYLFCNKSDNIKSKISQNLSESVLNLKPGNKSINKNTTSFGLLKTNVKLSGNIKLVVNDNNQIYLDTIESNEQLANSKFKKFKLTENGFYPSDIKRFLNNGNVPPEIVFAHKEPDNNAIKNNLNEQYFNFYNSGAYNLNSKLYNEKIAYFAPIWLQKDLPEYFVIFKLDKPFNESTYINGEIDYMNIIKESEIIKTFNLGLNTTIGKYLRNIVNDNNYSPSPLNVSLNRDSLSYWKGIAYQNGVFSQKGEYAYEIFEDDRPILDFDNYFSSGFERNGIMCTNMLNLEFIFNDTASDLYTINRYFGLYVNKIDLLNFEIDFNKLELDTIQQPIPVLGVNDLPYSKVDLIQKRIDNSNIQLPIKNNTNQLPDKIDFDNKFFYIKDRNGDFSKVKNKLNSNLIELNKKKCNTNNYNGITEIAYQANSKLLLTKGHGHIKITINSNTFEINDELIIEDPNLLKFNRRWKIIATRLPELSEGETFSNSQLDKKTKTNITYFSIEGDVNSIATAITNAFNFFKNKLYTAYNINNDIYIFSNYTNESSNDMFLKGNLNDSNAILIYGQNLLNNNFEQRFVGGTSDIKQRVSLKKDFLQKLNGDELYKTITGYSKLRRYNIQGNFIDRLDYLEEPIFKNGKLIQYQNITNFDILTIEKGRFNLGFNNKLIAYNTFNPFFGVFSILPLKNFDTDTFSSDYSKYPIFDTRRYYANFNLNNINKNVEIELDINEDYLIETSNSLKMRLYYRDSRTNLIFDEYDLVTNDYIHTSLLRVNYNTTDVNLTLGSFNLETKLEKITIFKTNDDFNSIRKIYSDTDEDLNSFNGLVGLQDQITSQDETDFLKLKSQNDIRRFTFYNIETEYDYLEENYNVNTSILSKLSPTINKWVKRNSLDSRNNGYRLNNSLAFGISNLVPSIIITKQVPELFTHEWFYIDKYPQYYTKNNFKNSNSYLESSLNDIVKDNKTWYELLQDTDNDYFSKLLTVGDPTSNYDNNVVNKSIFEQYTYIENNKTFFKGFDIDFNTIDNIDNYKFSIILTQSKNDLYDNNPITLNMIKNDSQKFICLVIELKIDDYKLNNYTIDYALMYAMRSNLNNDSIYTNFAEDDKNLITASTRGLNYRRTNNTINNLTNKKYYKQIRYNDHILSSGIDLWQSKNLTNANLDLKITEIPFINSIINLNNELKVVGSIRFPLSPFQNDINLYEACGNFFYVNMNEGDYSTLAIDVIEEDFIVSGNRYMAINGIKDVVYDSNNNKYKILINSSGFTLNGSRSFISNPNQFWLQIDSFPSGFFTNPDIPQSDIYFNGGFGNNENILNNLSFESVKQKLNNNDYNLIQIGSQADFNITINEPNIVNKLTSLYVYNDDDKPQAFETTDVIGYKLLRRETQTNLYRYGGEYEPKFKNILNFNLRENNNFSELYNRDFLLENTCINSNISPIIKNQFYTKIADSSILVIGDDNAYEPVYPLINEVAIDKSDYNIFSSNWDSSYYFKYTSKSSYDKIDGFHVAKESKNYLGSKLVNTPTTIIFYEFESIELNEDVILNSNPQFNEIQYSQSETNIFLKIDLNLIILNHFKENMKIFEELVEYGYIQENEKDSIENNYISKNIIPLFELGYIQIRKSNNNDINNIIFNTNVNEFDQLEQDKTIVSELFKNYYSLTINLQDVRSFTYYIGIQIKRI